MKNLIKIYLDQYLEFDSNQLFKNTDYLVVFGGSLRDIVSNEPHNIKDIDIMCLPKSKKIADIILKKNGYVKYDLFSPDICLLFL